MTALNTSAARNAVAAQPRPSFAPLHTSPIDATSDPQARLTEVNPLSVTQGVNLPVGQSNASGMLNILIAPQLLWLFGDTIKKVFLAKVDAMDYVPGLPLTERTTRRKQLTTQPRTLEEKKKS